MTQKEVLEWAMNGVKAAWNHLYEMEKGCLFENVREQIKNSQMALMKKLLELGRMQDDLKEEESNAVQS